MNGLEVGLVDALVIGLAIDLIDALVKGLAIDLVDASVNGLVNGPTDTLSDVITKALADDTMISKLTSRTLYTEALTDGLVDDLVGIHG